MLPTTKEHTPLQENKPSSQLKVNKCTNSLCAFICGMVCTNSALTLTQTLSNAGGEWSGQDCLTPADALQHFLSEDTGVLCLTWPEHTTNLSQCPPTLTSEQQHQLPPCWEGRGESWNYVVEGGSLCHQGRFESRDGSCPFCLALAHHSSCALPPVPCMVGSPRVVGAGRGWSHG